MKTIKYYKINIPFSGEPEEMLEEYNIIATNKIGRLCINDPSFTTLESKKSKYSSYNVINQVSVYKSKWGHRDDGWIASCYFQCSEKVMRRKVLLELKKEIRKECFLDSEALRKLELILTKKKK